MAQALPRIGWIEASRTARGVSVRVGPGDDARVNRLCAALASDAVAGDPVTEAAWDATRALWPPATAARRRYLRAVAMLGLLSAAIFALAPHEVASRGSLPTRGMPAWFDSSRSTGDGAMRGSVVAGVLSAGLVAGSALAQDAVQWRVEDGGNGHWYQGVLLPAGLSTFAGAATQIESRGGRPAVFESSTEWNWYRQSCTNLYSGGAGHIGLYRLPNEAWRTLDGQPVTFTAWGPGLPNNYASQPATAWAHPQPGSCSQAVGCWEDYDYWETGYRNWIVEFSADCNSDGIVDFGQIRAGELEDTNANNIPDCCEQGIPCACDADIDSNDVVNAIDLAIIIGNWGTDGGKDYPQADIDGSGTIDGADLATVLSNWGPCE